MKYKTVLDELLGYGASNIILGSTSGVPKKINRIFLNGHPQDAEIPAE